MPKNYSHEVISKFLKDDTPSIFVLKDNSVYIGVLRPGYGTHYMVMSTNIHEGGMGFPRSYLKQIVLFNGLIYPKEEKGPSKKVDLLELTELVNKAGYDFC